MKQKFYRLDRILKHNAKYNIIFGGRSDGKTFAVLEHIIKDYFESNETNQGALIRRWQDDFIGKRGQAMFSSLVKEGLVYKYSDGRWNNIKYYASKWFFCNYDGDKHEIVETSDIPFCYGFGITAQEHDKSTSYPNVTNIFFDEFITRGGYIPDEFVLFCNVLSTIIRERDNVKIFMCGNTINKFCPYFQEMGLKHMEKMNAGDIDVYNYGDSGLKVAVEYSDIGRKFGKKSNVYFAFNNPKLQMITGGDWELDLYKHLPRKYRPKEKVFEFFVQFDMHLIHCEVIEGDKDLFVFVHPKTTPLQNPEHDLIYTTNVNNGYPNIRRTFTHPIDTIDQKILRLFTAGKFFYSDNETGDVLKNFLDTMK